MTDTPHSACYVTTHVADNRASLGADTANATARANLNMF